MCIQMPNNYNHTMILTFNVSSENNDDHIYIDTNDEPPPLVPIQSPYADFEYLHLIDKIQMNHQNMEQYENIQYIIGTILSLYGIYYFVCKIVDSIYKKNI
jgi:hypothetical protein